MEWSHVLCQPKQDNYGRGMATI